jgi:hypothetical protein
MSHSLALSCSGALGRSCPLGFSGEIYPTFPEKYEAVFLQDFERTLRVLSNVSLQYATSILNMTNPYRLLHGCILMPTDQSDRIEIILIYLEGLPGFNPNLTDKWNCSPLMKAYMKQNPKIFDWLTRQERINLNSAPNLEVLFLACAKGDRGVVARFASKVVLNRVRSRSGDSCLKVASTHERHKIVKMLLRHPHPDPEEIEDRVYASYVETKEFPHITKLLRKLHQTRQQVSGFQQRSSILVPNRRSGNLGLSPPGQSVSKEIPFPATSTFKQSKPQPLFFQPEHKNGLTLFSPPYAIYPSIHTPIRSSATQTHKPANTSFPWANLGVNN